MRRKRGGRVPPRYPWVGVWLIDKRGGSKGWQALNRRDHPLPSGHMSIPPPFGDHGHHLQGKCGAGVHPAPTTKILFSPDSYTRYHGYDPGYTMSASIEHAGTRDPARLQHLAHLLTTLNTGERETLELLLDPDATEIVHLSVTEFRQGKGISISPW